MRHPGALAGTGVSVALVVVLLGCGAASAQVRYVDGQGVVHWVQSLDQVPPEYRGQGQPRLPLGGGSASDPGFRAKQRFEDESRRRRSLRELPGCDKALPEA